MHGSEIDLQVPKYVVSLFTADIISCVEFNQDGDLLATGDKGGRVVIFQRDPAVSDTFYPYSRLKSIYYN